MMPPATELQESLPAGLRGPDTTITKVAAGLSGAGVYRVDAGGRAYVLKVTAPDAPVADWRRRLDILHRAADAGLAPRLVHVDEARRAVVSEFVADRSFPRYYRDPATHDEALATVGRTIARLHALPVPDDAPASDPHAFLAGSWSAVSDWTVPAFVRDTVERMMAEQPPGPAPALVLSHNDANPSNLVYDGERLLFFDWDTAGPNDPYYDLAALSLFLRMDAATCAGLLGAYHDAPPPAELPARFLHHRRLVGALACAVFMGIARRMGAAVVTGEETREGVTPLGELYMRMTQGTFSLATAEGQWQFAQALLLEGQAL